jgi:two-component system CheB/CheR fusion protein
VVGIGASAGGLEAFRLLLEHLPTDTGMAFILVQHLDPTHESILAALLSRATEMPVNEVTQGIRVEPNHVYIIPRNTNMAITNGALRLLPREETRGQHRPIDFFLRSLAEEKGNRAIGVILSGTASDGTLGLEAIKAEGGITFAQDEKTAKYDGMPRSAIAAGCVDFELPPDRIAEELARLARHPHVTTVDAARREELLPADEEPVNSFTQILRLVRKLTGVDFSLYKPTTIRRRITRRTALLKLDGLKAYADYLRNHKEEIENLYQDILIGVTSFFRDPETYETLKEKVFPELIKKRDGDKPLRVWVVGCSTGEEAYSIAIAFLEFTGARLEIIPIQIFATDINDKAIARARAGVYTQSLVNDVSPERLRRFFVKINSGYQISKPIRDMCVFAQQNVLTDPPFSHIDMVSCRNLLIYLDAAMQKKVIPALHYSLKPSGFLLLGSSETVGSFANLFELKDRKHKIYSKLPGPSQVKYRFMPGEDLVEKIETSAKAIQAREETAVDTATQREVDRIILQKYAPASVLTNADWEILQFHGATSVYLEAPPGKATHNLLRLAREGLLVPLRSALNRAKKTDRPVRQEGLRVNFGGHIREFNLEIIQIKSEASKERRFLALFEPIGPIPEPKPGEAGKAGRGRRTKREPALKESEARLQQELQSTREYLQSVIEQQDASAEELQSANEEIQSSNEELQSINEELETAKEELQSSNEELTTINQELIDSNQEAMRINNDLVNLLSSVQMPIVMLGNDLHIRRFTPMAERLLNLVATDVGRPITDLKLNLDLPNLPELLMEVIDTVSAREMELQDQKGRWHSFRIRPYKTLENKIEGVVIVMVDIDQLKRAEESLREQYRLIETSYEPIFVWDYESGIVEWNQGCAQLYGFTRAEAIGRVNHELLRTFKTPSPEEVKARLAEQGEWTGELRQMTKDGREVIVESRQQLSVTSGRRLVLETNHDITSRKQAEERLRESEERFRLVTDSAPVPIWVNGADGGCEFVNKTYLDFFGKTLAEVQGFGWQPHAHPEDSERYVSSYFAAFNARAPFHCQARFQNTRGEYRWIESVGLPRFSASGEFLGYVGASPDITEIKQVELTTQFINHLDLEMSLITDTDKIIRLATSKLGEYLDVSRCYLSEIKPADGLAIIHEGWDGWVNGAHSMAGEYRIGDFATQEFRDAIEAGQTIIINNVTTDPRTSDFVARYEPFGIGALTCVPILNEKRWEATLSVAHSQARDWRPDELQLTREVAARLWAEVKRARAVEALRLSEEQARRTLIEQMVAGVAECDATGKYTLVNQRYCDIVGYSNAELLGMRMEDITSPKDWPHNAELHRRLFENGESFFIENRYRRKDGSEIWTSSHVSPIRNAQGDVEESVAIVIDITSRKLADDEREQLLEQERVARAEAQAANQSKDEFLAVVSHELRSPLNSILGYTRLLRSETTNAAQIQQMVDIIERNGRIQLQLIEDLLDVARIITGKLNLEVQPVDLINVITGALDVVRPSAQAKRVELRANLDPNAGQITGDPDRLQQVVWNLLTNSIKFTEEGGRIEIILKREAPYIAIVVSDTGKGIEPEFLPHIFDRFRQADMSSMRRAGGLGLGLSLVKQLVELHGGTVDAQSAGAGQGATFTILLPPRAVYVAPPIERPHLTPSTVVGPESLAGVRALIVDDEEEVRSMLILTLQSYGAEARAMASGKEALEALARQTPEEHFDVLICDIAMPDEDGYTVMRKMRALPPDQGGAIPAIALTAYGRAEDRVRALEAGFRMHLAKPVESDELAVVILSLINRFGPNPRS